MLPSITKSIFSAIPSASTNFCIQQTRSMSKYLSKAAAKRRPLTAKRAKKGFYKGKGGTQEGTHSGRAGKYIMDPKRMLELVVPDLTGFKVCIGAFLRIDENIKL